MVCAICPGSFDPITLGHVDLISRAAGMFPRVVVAVSKNTEKTTLFTREERAELIRGALKELKNVEVTFFDGLLAEFAREYSPAVLVKGLRNTIDFEYEMQMSVINKSQNSALETVFLPCDPRWYHISSAVIKDLYLYGGDAGGYLPENALCALKKKYIGL